MDRDRERERRQTRPEISSDALSHRAQPHRLAPRRPADALEALRHALEPLGIRLKMRNQLTARRTRILAQIINPTREAHERGAQLVGRLARHRHPQPVAGRADAFADRPGGEQDQTEEHRGLQQRQTGQRARLGQRPIMDRADARLDEWRVNPIELRDPRAALLIARARTERGVVERRDSSRGVSYGDRDAEASHFIRERQQRVSRRALPRIVQPRKHVPEQPARLARVRAQVACDDPGVPHR